MYVILCSYVSKNIHISSWIFVAFVRVRYNNISIPLLGSVDIIKLAVSPDPLLV